MPSYLFIFRPFSDRALGVEKQCFGLTCFCLLFCLLKRLFITVVSFNNFFKSSFSLSVSDAATALGFELTI